MLRSIRTASEEIIKTSLQKNNKVNIDTVDENFWQGQPIFCPYQTKLVTDESPVSVVEKGRQIGASYTYAFRASFKAASNIRDSIVTSYNKAAVKQFIKDACTWARIINSIFDIISYQEIVNEKDLNVFEMRFLNGRVITGLAGNSVNLRSYSGRDLYVDEASYRAESLEDILAAGLATIIHGGTVRILSTHSGIDSDFNNLIKKIKAGELPYNHFKITFRDAVSQGLFKRMCAKKQELWTQEKEDAWIAEIYELYGNRASEELDAIPSDYSLEGKIFNGFKFIDLPPLNNWEYIDFRYHDLAATSDKEELKDSIYYSASVKIRLVLETNKLVIVDWSAEKLSPLEGDAKIIELALEDGKKSVQLIEEEPGSSGSKYVSIMQERLIKNGIFQVFGYRPTIDKVKRAIPAGNAIQTGEMLISQNLKDREEFCNYLKRFSSKKIPLTTDLGDCVSGIYDYVRNEYNFMLS